MGAWGVEPFDNDSALDLLGPIEDFAAKHIEMALRLVTYRRKRDYHEAIAAVALLLEFTGKSPLNLRYEATRKTNLYALATLAIEIIQRDSDWIAEWKDPLKVALMLKRLHRQVALHAAAGKKQDEKLKILFVRKSGKRKPRRVA